MFDSVLNTSLAISVMGIKKKFIREIINGRKLLISYAFLSHLAIIYL